MIPAHDDQLGWQADALCTQTDPEAFFPEAAGDHAFLAKQVCALCPVTAQCLTWALLIERREGSSWGVYGGLSAVARRRIITRTRKDAA